MTTTNPDVQALIEEARLLLSDSEIGNRTSRNILIGRMATALSALSGETETEWGNEYILQPGEVHAVYDEKEARSYVERFPKWRRLVKRQVTRTGWEVVV